MTTCREEVIKSLKNLKWKVNNQRQEKYAPNECVVYVSGVKVEIDTTESYIFHTELTIEYNEDDPRRLNERIVSILSHVEADVVSSGADWCTSFKFQDQQVGTTLGTTMNIKLICDYKEIVYHG